MKGITSNPALDAYQRTAVSAVTPGRHSSQGSDAPVSGTTAQAARVTISSEARALAEGAEGFDAQKVERLRNALAAGSLKFDYSLIAEKLIDQSV